MHTLNQWVHAHPWVAIAIVGLVAANLAILLLCVVQSGRRAPVVTTPFIGPQDPTAVGAMVSQIEAARTRKEFRRMA